MRSDLTTISVIVPVRDKARWLNRCIGSIVDAARCTSGVQLILVDNGSTDGSLEILQESFGGFAHILTSAGRNPGSVRNDGAKQATGSILCFLDADCVVPTGYFAAVRDVLAEPSVSVSGCAVDLPTDEGWIERTWYRLHHRGLDGYRAYINSGNFVLRRSAFESVGGFDESLETGEDANIGARLDAAGMPPYESHRLRVLHLDNPKTLGAFFRKEVWHAAGMFGTTGFGRIDRPVVMTFAHGGMLVLTTGLATLSVLRQTVPLALAALSAFILIPVLAVAYRRVLALTPGLFLQEVVLYEAYFLARVTALLQLLLRRNRKQRRLPMPDRSASP